MRLDRRRDRRVLQVVSVLYTSGPMPVLGLARRIAEATGESAESVRRVIYRILPYLRSEGIVEWRGRQVKLTPVAAEAFSWLLDCMESKPCRLLAESYVRTGEFPHTLFKARDMGVRL